MAHNDLVALRAAKGSVNGWMRYPSADQIAKVERKWFDVSNCRAKPNSKAQHDTGHVLQCHSDYGASKP